MHDAIVCADAAGDITMWLGGAEKIFGYREHEVLGTSLTALMPERYRADHLAALTTYTPERPARVVGSTVELAGLRRDGSEFPLELSLSEGTHGGRRFFAGIIRDISQRKVIEAELERSNAELTQFASVASHDLSEPLRVIEGFADLLTRRYAGRLDDDADVFLGHITSASVRMRALIDALLRYARAGNAPLERERVQTGELAAQAAEALGARFREGGTEVTVADGLPEVTADKTLLRQVFQNLLANGAKHATRKGARVAVTAERVGDDWRFSVRDNGPGIAPEDQERIFEMFARGRRVATPGDAGPPAEGEGDRRGAGIGLSICQRVVERHGGRIWVESVPGRGADFRFTLPAGETTAAAPG